MNICKKKKKTLIFAVVAALTWAMYMVTRNEFVF